MRGRESGRREREGGREREQEGEEWMNLRLCPSDKQIQKSQTNNRKYHVEDGRKTTLYRRMMEQKGRKMDLTEEEWDIPHALFGLVGVCGTDGANVGYHGFLHHTECIAGFGEDWWFIHIQHPDVHLPHMSTQTLTLESGFMCAFNVCFIWDMI